MKHPNQHAGIFPPPANKIVDLASFRRDRSLDNWVLAVSALGFCVLSGMFAAKVATLLGAGGIQALIQWVR
jgi:hypothetical protein